MLITLKVNLKVERFKTNHNVPITLKVNLKVELLSSTFKFYLVPAAASGYYLSKSHVYSASKKSKEVYRFTYICTCIGIYVEAYLHAYLHTYECTSFKCIYVHLHTYIHM